ncbi:MAG: hypothetical protein LH647_12010 [Leptolyngbyaceae cyanobacterium CAN_BIN12]|nr:hypothetical protein [Leptolyngbyaceae cyanobacterium CAN_BIN12]
MLHTPSPTRSPVPFATATSSRFHLESMNGLTLNLDTVHFSDDQFYELY